MKYDEAKRRMKALARQLLARGKRKDAEAVILGMKTIDRFSDLQERLSKKEDLNG